MAHRESGNQMPSKEAQHGPGRGVCSVGQVPAEGSTRTARRPDRTPGGSRVKFPFVC
jgi:hypothetical protein